jgi:succinate-acetate transporter protein
MFSRLPFTPYKILETNTSQRDLNMEKPNGTSALDHANNGTVPAKKRTPYDYGGNPLAHVATNDSQMRLQAFGGEFQPGLYRPSKSNFANPAPLGLSAFALTTFVLSLINVKTRAIPGPNIVVALAFGYGGLVQLLAGMWYVPYFLTTIIPHRYGDTTKTNTNEIIREMAVGNTFGATALSSYGGFWLSFAIILTPGGFEIASTLSTEGGEAAFLNSFGLFLMGWFIFTTILVLCTLRSTVAFFFLFFTLDMAFLLLGIGYLQNDGAKPQGGCIVAGGAFGLMAAFAAWYNALAGIADSSNRYVPSLLSWLLG